MNKNDLFKAVAFLLDQTKVGAELLFHYEKEGESILLKAPTVVDTVNRKISKNFSESVTATFSGTKDFEVLPISQVRESDIGTTYYFYNTSYPDGLIVMFAKDIGEYNFEYHSYSAIKGFVIKLTYGEEEVILYKTKNPTDLHVKPTVMTLWRMGNAFTSPSDESIILTDKFDYILIQSNLIVINLNQLERKHKFTERIKLHSESIIKSLKKEGKHIIDKFDKLEAFLADNINFAKKMEPINYNGILWKIDFQKIKLAIESDDKLKKHLRFNKNGDKFSINSMIAAKLFFSLSNDLIMKSIISGQVVTVTEKDEIPR